MKTKQHGSTTVEVAIGIPIILVAFFGWIELCMVTYSMSMIDDAFTLAVSSAKKSGHWDTTDNYIQQIEKELRSHGGALSTQLVPESSVDINVYYFKNFQSLDRCSSLEYSEISDCPDYRSESKGSPIAMYELTYDYHPLISAWFPDLKIKREIITVQEYERCNLVYQKFGCKE
ncbi:TadE family protein [Vibrio parahaemolyticus]|uniref:TadE family protein n=1 Tax=Vibrio parahaemolyticus TaxID=670 RepID=UPI003892903F